MKDESKDETKKPQRVPPEVWLRVHLMDSLVIRNNERITTVMIGDIVNEVLNKMLGKW